MNCILSIDKSNLSSRTNRTPTDFQDLSALIICLLRIKFRLSVGETCGLPRANRRACSDVRPYRVLDNFSANFARPLGGAPFLCNKRWRQSRHRPHCRKILSDAPHIPSHPKGIARSTAYPPSTWRPEPVKERRPVPCR